ncbi:MAG: hypothetical protein HY886_10045 [Deltaproteobacteria bacterium]|nr:hypothetical protein [Deltaproteobacteria bacterium]
MNMKIPALSVIITALCLASAIECAAAAVSLPWSTSFNTSGQCNDWTQANGLSGTQVNCDNLTGWGSWTCDDSGVPGTNGAAGTGPFHEEQITSSANNPAGGGGKGQRHWKGWNGTNSPNATNNSGGLSIDFAAVQPELWVRWYMRYQAGFKWANIIEDKIIYFDVVSTQTSVIVAWQGYGTGSDTSKILAQSGGSQTFISSAGKGWDGTMGGAASDGLWHYYEVHLKMNTSGANGMAEMWIDGIQTVSAASVDWRPGGTGSYLTGWNYVLFGSNSRSPDNSYACAYADFDDITISNTGYIGPLGGLAKPQAPVLSTIP